LARSGGADAHHRLAARAPAKINLTLHVLGRRADGRHELESLVAFARIGDGLRLVPGPHLALTVEGPTAASAGPVDENLVLRATRLLAGRVEELRIGAFTLTKRLPVAAGLGGGSSDAAAALRLLARLNQLAPTEPALLSAAESAGADVPVCFFGRARVMRGAGERLGPVLTLPPLPALLVNPGVPLETAAVFGALRGASLKAGNSGHPEIASGLSLDELLSRIGDGRNDLEGPAVRLAPVVGDALALLRETPGCRLARMSGSGATVFGLFGDPAATQTAAHVVRQARPRWWVRPTQLG
jgi:4-diphosphocytidyl-2-C-methyl-D-erythritol kinase